MASSLSINMKLRRLLRDAARNGDSGRAQLAIATDHRLKTAYSR